MEKSNFDQLLKRYLTGKISDAEKAKLEAWLDVMKTENTKDLELNSEDEEKLFKKIVSNRDNIKEIESFLPFKDEEKQPPIRWIFKIAASLFLVALIGYLVWSVRGSNQLTFSSEKSIEKIILNDGTLVWLQKGSKLIYLDATGQDKRYAELEGEALFEVAKDPSHPFQIKFNGATIRVLGTSFSVSPAGEGVLVKVLTGKVNLSNASNATGVDIEPNQKASISPAGIIAKMPMMSSEVKDITDGTEYMMSFTEASLNEVLKYLEQKFDVTFSLTDKTIGKCRITADLTDQSLDHSEETIHEILNVDFEKKGNVIIVDGQGCQ